LKNKRLAIFIFVFYCRQFYAQRSGDETPADKRYTQNEVLDTAAALISIPGLIGSLGGDSVTYIKSGYYRQGWNEDFYKSGKLLHRGYYVDGKLITF